MIGDPRAGLFEIRGRSGMLRADHRPGMPACLRHDHREGVVTGGADQAVDFGIKARHLRSGDLRDVLYALRVFFRAAAQLCGKVAFMLDPRKDEETAPHDALRQAGDRIQQNILSLAPLD